MEQGQDAHLSWGNLVEETVPEHADLREERDLEPQGRRDRAPTVFARPEAAPRACSSTARAPSGDSCAMYSRASSSARRASSAQTTRRFRRAISLSTVGQLPRAKGCAPVGRQRDHARLLEVRRDDTEHRRGYSRRVADPRVRGRFALLPRYASPNQASKSTHPAPRGHRRIGLTCCR